MAVIRVGLIGAGGVAQRHARVLSALGGRSYETPVWMPRTSASLPSRTVTLSER